VNHKITISGSLTPEALRAKVKEADLYLSQGLFNAARENYQSLLDHFEFQAEGTTPPGKPTDKVAQRVVKNLQQRLREVDRQFDAFYGRPRPSGPRDIVDAHLDKKTIFDSALALKGIGLHKEAIREFKRAAKLRYRTRQCYEEIADCLIEKGAFLEAIKIFRALLQSKNTRPTQRIAILEKIASAYEAAGDNKKAGEVYRELAAIEKAHQRAAQKIDRLTGELKPTRFTIGLVTEHPRIFLIIFLIIACIFSSFAPFTKTVNNVDYFTLEDNPDVEFYDRFKEIFGNDEFFVIAFENPDIFTPKNLTLIQNITEELEELEEAKDVISLTNVDDMIGGPDYFEVRKFLEDIPEGNSELKRLKKQATENPLYVKSLISHDARTAAIIVQTYDRPDDEDYRKRLLNKTKKILDPYRKDVDQFYLAGWTTTNLSLSQYMKKDIVKFIPITYILVALTVLLVFRNLRLTLLAVANISACMLSTMGLFAISGITLNNVTTIVPPLVMALSLSDTVHIFSHMEKRVLDEFPDKRQALAHVLRKVVLPCFLTTVTTAVGFLSLAVSEIPPIKQFAYVASAGMVFEFMYSFFLLPPLVLFFSPEKIYAEYQTRRGLNRILRSINNLVQAHSRPIVVVSCILVLVACWFATRIRTETNLVEYFKRSSPVRTSLDFVEKTLSGVGSLDISLKAKEEDAFKEPSNLRVIDTLQRHIKSLKGVDVTVSFVDFIKDMNESFHDEDPRYNKIPDNREMVSQYLLLYDSDDMEDFINEDYDHARIAVRIAEHGSAAQDRLIREIRNYIAKIDHPHLDIRITGRAVQDVNTIDALVKSQIYSLSLAAAVIFIIMFVVFRSMASGFLSIVPNVFPIILNFGIMGAAGIPLNTATALISAVALGIAVDDTIHFISAYSKQRAQNVSIPKAVERVILTKGRAIVSSSLILCIGFGVLTLSSFVPTVHFGMLSAIIMITAVIGDIIILPSIVLLRKSKLEPSDS